MARGSSVLKCAALLICVGTCTSAAAEVVSIDVSSRQPWLGGQAFGDIGAYEVLRGTVHYAVDPRSASARGITDIRHAPTNNRGQVEYSGPFVLIRPVDGARGNQVTLVEAANRGRTQMDGLFFETEDGLDLSAPERVVKLTDTTFFRLGYTLAWVGWQGRLDADQFGLQVPTARVHSRTRATFAADELTDGKSFDLPGNGFYCGHDAAQRGAVLRAQTRFDDPGSVIPRTAWSFAPASAEKKAEARCGIVFKTHVAPDAYFSLVYEGENATVMGLGEAAFRDFAEHLKSKQATSAINRPGDAIAVFAYGYSQGGRFLRDFLYRGFNTGSDGKRVFDGMLITTAGAGRGSFNHRYALPGEAGNSVMSNLRAVDLYPFADVPTPDLGGGGAVAGLLDRAEHDGTVPKIMYIIGSSEYWARNASLLQTTVDGRHPVDLGADTRLYFYSGAPHAPRTPSSFTKPGKEAAYPYNANVDLADGLNAQLENLRAWVIDGELPPPSVAPVPGSTLVPADALHFPAIPGIRVPMTPPPLWRLDLGKGYAREGVIREPVRVSGHYRLLVPDVDSDGNELGGWRGALASVPLGTYTAWNWKSPTLERYGFISGLNGAFIPFARTRAERIAAHDPRRSIQERYGDRDGYIKTATASIDHAIQARFLLPMQRDAIIAKMGAAWDDAMKFDWYLGEKRAPSK